MRITKLLFLVFLSVLFIVEHVIELHTKNTKDFCFDIEKDAKEEIEDTLEFDQFIKKYLSQNKYFSIFTLD